MDFRNDHHLQELLHWLNGWGCRQFAKQYHSVAMQEIGDWADAWEGRLPTVDTHVAQLSDDAIDAIGEAFADLSRRQASVRNRKLGESPVTVGATGAAKILFAARPHAIAPWDDKIRKSLHFDQETAPFSAFTKLVRKQVRHVTEEASRFGVSDLPKELDRPFSSLPKLIDEYYFITCTRNAVCPDAPELSRWYKWCTGARPRQAYLRTTK